LLLYKTSSSVLQEIMPLMSMALLLLLPRPSCSSAQGVLSSIPQPLSSPLAFKPVHTIIICNVRSRAIHTSYNSGW
jgi:hypothetical protein